MQKRGGKKRNSEGEKKQARKHKKIYILCCKHFGKHEHDILADTVKF
jgi:hypothetical protein